MEFVSITTSLSPTDYEQAAALLRVPLAAIYAVAEVEASGEAFLEDTRPKILYEAHIFSRLTNHRYDSTHPNISSPTWNRRLYGPAGAHQYDRLYAAIALDREAALKSCSWGMFQILGLHHQLAGHADVESFVADLCTGEAAHLRAFTHFIKSNNRLRRALEALDWTTFARLYNGPAYAANQYDIKLARAYAKHSRRLSHA